MTGIALGLAVGGVCGFLFGLGCGFIVTGECDCPSCDMEPPPIDGGNGTDEWWHRPEPPE